MKNYLRTFHYKAWLMAMGCLLYLGSFSQTFAKTAASETIESKQEISVSGTVTSEEDGSPVPGVNILVKGTTTGTVSDINGTYKLSVDENATLVFSAIGFTTEEIPVSSRSVIDVALVADIQSLSEVVVTGYSTQERKDITGAVSTVSAEEMTAIPAGNAEQQLQGRVAGVTVITSGAPGSGSLVRVRGFGSFTNNVPLYIVDGVPISDISFINSNDIESTTILKDAGAASIYGSRASAGVVIITTKKGKKGEPTITYDGSYGTQLPGKGFDLLNPQQTADIYKQSNINSGTDFPNNQFGNGTTAVLPDYILPEGATESEVDFDLYNRDFDSPYQIIKANKAGTDWYDEVTDPAPIQNHTLAVSGSGDNSNYYVGLGYYDQEGIVLNTYLKRYTLRANTQFTVKDNIRIGENFQVSYRQTPGFNNLNEGNALSHAYRINPIIPVYDIMGNWAGTVAPGFNNPQNPIANQTRAKDNKNVNTIIFGNVFGEVDFLENFTARTSFGGGYGNFHNYYYNYRTYENSENNASNTFNESAGYGYNWVWTNTVKFEKKFDVHNLSALVGVEAVEDGIYRQIMAQRQNYYLDEADYRTIDAGNAGSATNGGSAGEGVRLFSYFGQVNYSFKDKYLLGLILRRDGSSNFSDENKYGLFPAVTAAWRLSEENFLSSQLWINDLKIRGGYGEMGNQAIQSGNQSGAFSSDPRFSAYALDGSNTSTQTGFYRTRLGNPLGEWEVNKTLNIGLDGTFFNSSLEFVVDLYKKNTEKLLYNPETPAIYGYLAQYPFINIGEMENKGIDLQIIKKGKVGSDFTYEAELTFSHYKNEILKVTEGSDEFSGPITGSNRIGSVTLNKVGHAISSFYGYEVVGLFESDADVDSSPDQVDAAPGRFKYADVNGDNVITPDDRTIFGDPNPDFTYGLNIKFGYKNFDLEMFFYGVQGQDIFNYTRWFTDFPSTFEGSALSTRVSNAWTPTNTNTDVPRAESVANFSTSTQANSYYMEDGSYFRARNIQLGYTLPANLINQYGIDKLKIYVQATNLFTATKYTGLDPAISGVDTNFGIDYGNYPIVKQFIVGVNLAF